MTLLDKGPWVATFPRGRKRKIRYRARFWDSDSGRHYERDCDDIAYDRGDGRLRFLNTSPNVSYYSSLTKAAA